VRKRGRAGPNPRRGCKPGCACASSDAGYDLGELLYGALPQEDEDVGNLCHYGQRHRGTVEKME
jgi:hypothetical protein